VPCGQRITALLEGVPDLDGVFGGAGGRFVLDELARGAAGSMPACEVTELHVGLYEAFRAGRMDEARRIFNALLPLLNLGSAYRTPITKHVLGRRGVLSATRHRDNNPVLDRFDIAELDTVWSALEQQLA
jgi:4-hydroxy-tetrahydrodipicolinate synthase